MRHVLPACALMFLASACLSPSEAPQRRYFDPGVVGSPAPIVDPKPGAEPVALGRVTAAMHLREPMVWRLSDLELAFDADNVWVGEVTTLVQRKLEADLHDTGRFASWGTEPVRRLEVHVASFEGSLEAEPAAHVMLIGRVDFRPGRSEVEVRTFTSEVPLSGRSPSALAAGMRVALGDAVSQIADWLDE